MFIVFIYSYQLLNFQNFTSFYYLQLIIRQYILNPLSSMKNFLSFYYTLILFVFFYQGENISSPRWVVNPEVQAASYQIINRDRDRAASQKGDGTYITTILFSEAFKQRPKIIFGISSFQMLWTGHRDFLILTQMITKSEFSMKALLYDSNAWLLQIRYLAFDSTFPHHINIFQNIPINYSSNQLVRKAPPGPYPQHYLEYFNYTKLAQIIGSRNQILNPSNDKNKIILFITSLQMKNINENEKSRKAHTGIQVKAQCLNNTFFKIESILGSSYSFNTIHFNIMVYDQLDIQSSGKYAFVSQSISNFGVGPISFNPIFFKSLIIGLSSIKACKSSEDQFYFSTKFSQLNSQWNFQVSPRQSKYVFTLVYLNSWECPQGTYLDHSSHICTFCSISGCKICLNSTFCLKHEQQSSSLNLFLKNQPIKTKRILLQCSVANCIECCPNDTLKCKTCSPNSIMLNSRTLCQICDINCIRCLSSATCFACNTTNSYFVNGSICSYCDPTQNKFISAGTQICTLCILTNCLQCTSLVSCSSCNTTNSFYLNGTICSFCDPFLNYFINSSNLNCQACSILGCINCFSLTNCSICNITDGYLHNATTGLCQPCGPGLFRNLTDQLCYTCSLIGCYHCSSEFICSICDMANSYYLNGSTCLYCDPFLQTFVNPFSLSCQPCQLSNCLNCSTFLKCQICNQSAGFFLNTTSGLCQLCSLLGCIQCLSFSECLVCDSNNSFAFDYTSPNRTLCGPCNVSCSCDGYTTPWLSTSKTCTPICGDGLIRLGQECDDNNTDPGDGCSSSCTIEPNFMCDQAEPTTCNESLLVQTELISILKHGCNGFKISTKLTPQFTLNQIAPTVSFFNSGIIVKDVSQNNGIIEIVAEYIQDIANQTIKLRLLSAVLLNITYTPEIPALRYTEAECKATESTYVFFQAVQIISYIVLLFSLISCKIVGLQLFGVLQLSYFTLSMQDFFVLYLAPLAKFRTFNGLNIQFTKQQTPLPTNFTRLSVASSFTNNCNIMLILLFGQLIVSIVLYIIAKTTNRDKLRKVALRMLKQGFITLVIFNIFNISYSAGVHWKYASAADDGYILSSIILYGTLIAAIVATFAMCITDADDYGEFKNKFKHVWICRAYIPLTILYRAILGFYTAVQSDYSQGTLLIIGFAIAFMMYNIVNFPFYNTLQNYRATFVHITMLYTLLASNYYAGMKMNTPLEAKGRQYTVAIIELVLIVITLVMSSITLSYEIYQIFKNCKRNRRAIREQKNPTEESLQAL